MQMKRVTFEFLQIEHSEGQLKTSEFLRENEIQNSHDYLAKQLRSKGYAYSKSDFRTNRKPQKTEA